MVSLCFIWRDKAVFKKLTNGAQILHRGLGRCLKLSFLPTECNGFRVDRDRVRRNDSENPHLRKHRFGHIYLRAFKVCTGSNINLLLSYSIYSYYV